MKKGGLTPDLSTQVEMILNQLKALPKDEKRGALQGVLAALLPNLEQPWSNKFYEALAPHVALTAVETVFLRKGDGGILETLLIDRPKGDVYYGLVHTPGSMLRATDASFEDAIKRVMDNEINIPDAERGKLSVAYVGSFVHSTPRGTEIAAVHTITVPSGIDFKKGRWVPINKMPENIIKHIPAIVDFAVAKRPSRI